MKLLLSIVLLLQGVRMTEDFLPLGVGNQWVYDVFSEAGQKVGQLSFTVNDRAIVSGRTIYGVTDFPFGGESAVAVRQIGFDRDARQFVRIAGDQVLPLFPGDETSAEILQSDSSGIPQKFALRTGSTSLIFQRGVGIVEARYPSADGLRIAKIAATSVGRPAVTPRATVTIGGPPVVAAPAGNTPTAAPSTTSEVTAENPVLSVSVDRDAEGLKLELLVVNTTNKLLPFRFTSSKTYDFIIQDPATGQEVWRWSNRMMFSQVIRSDSIRGNSKWTFTEVWNLRDNDDNRVSPGRYRLTGVLSAQPPIESKPVMFEVR